MRTTGHGVPNPSTPRRLKPVEFITDRAKRYRANRNPPPGKKRCGFCAATRNIDIDHIDGDESHGEGRNLMYLCRTCNTLKGVTQARAGRGTRTRQYNPQRQPTFREYIDAVMVLRGDEPAGNVASAALTLRAASPERRAEFTERIARARNPEPATPGYKQYAYAVSIHTRGAHDEGGEIIHATPPAIRSDYARRIAASKRRKRSDVPF